MMILIVVLLVLWLIVAVIGFAFKGLVWLAIVGIVLFLGTAAVGFVRRKADRR
ncbi:LPXTG cell wall anchor domain-containing protein [Amycolatopsis sp. NPDC059657]|uniref:LPXTG cell wall anchor domain-containing protein n=1 Tax=Amycolatopsis sp. NPDC059657 TaxID=3346899 RepID=UPI00366DE435